jgi:hypothetical protein
VQQKRGPLRERKDVEEAGRRSVCQYLLWLFSPADDWADLQSLYGNVPVVGGLRGRVLEEISKERSSARNGMRNRLAARGMS